METKQLIILCLFAILIALGTILIYNAREIVTKFFSTQNQNAVVRGIKLFGSIISLVSSLFLVWYL